MPRTIEVKLYKYEELSEEAKEKARDWWRERGLGYEWWDGVYDMAKEAGKMLGFEIEGINFSGFWSQGDGARFHGSWSASDVDADKLREEWPKDEELHSYAAVFEDIAKRNPEASMSITYSGNYEHSGCTQFSQDFPYEYKDDSTSEEDTAVKDAAEDDAETAKENARWFMDWIYKQLEKEYEYLNSDEQVAEAIDANEYEFLEDGSRA